MWSKIERWRRMLDLGEDKKKKEEGVYFLKDSNAERSAEAVPFADVLGRPKSKEKRKGTRGDSLQSPKGGKLGKAKEYVRP